MGITFVTCHMIELVRGGEEEAFISQLRVSTVVFLIYFGLASPERGRETDLEKKKVSNERLDSRGQKGDEQTYGRPAECARVLEKPSNRACLK